MKAINKAFGKSASGDVKADHNRQLPRLSRIEGQVRGLAKMIDENRNCLDIIHQISAVASALRRVQSDMLHDQLAALGEAVIAGTVSQKKRREMADELAALLKRLS